MSVNSLISVANRRLKHFENKGDIFPKFNCIPTSSNDGDCDRNCNLYTGERHFGDGAEYALISNDSKSLFSFRATKLSKVTNTNHYPFRAICKLIIFLNNGQISYGTGFFISPKCIITSAHCVFNTVGRRLLGWASSIAIIPGFYDFCAPYSCTISEEFRVVKQYYDNQNRDYDIGAIILEDDKLYNRVGTCLNYSDILPIRKVLFSGYPALNVDYHARSQWMCYDHILKVSRNQRKIIYKFDTEEGCSGGPICTENSLGNLEVIGIHRGDNKRFSSRKKECVKITPEIEQKFNEWASI